MNSRHMMILLGIGLFCILPGTVDIPLFADVEAVTEYRFRPCTKAALQEFAALVRREAKDARQDLEKKYADNPKKVEHHAISVAYRLIESTAGDLVRRADAGEPMSVLEPAFSRLQRLHYSTMLQELCQH